MIRKIECIISEIEDQYLLDENSNRPWIIEFCGGKDSTALLQIVWLALKRIPNELRNRKIYVVCNDTMVENPIITEYVDEVLIKIQQSAVEQNLPIFVQKTIPRLEDSFWVNIIGRGYPVPNNAFRWCTEKMKIKPTSRFIIDQVSDYGEAIILLGTRISESSNRAKTIKRHEIKGKRLTKHPNHANLYIYSPLKHLVVEYVWFVINSISSPWGADNKVLYNKITILPELVGLFKSNWASLFATNHTCLFSLPFYHLSTEPFWNLVPNPGCEIWVKSKSSMRSFANLTTAIKYAIIH